MSIPLMIGGKHLYQIMLTPEEILWIANNELNKAESSWTEEDINTISRERCLYPTSVALTSETYSRNASRTADYELETLQIVNRKAKPEFTWDIIKSVYVQRLMQELQYTYGFKRDEDNSIIPIEAPTFEITYTDFVGTRTIKTYLGQTIDGTLEEYHETPKTRLGADQFEAPATYWRNFRIAFPER